MTLVTGWDDDVAGLALGRVVDEGRGSLPFALVHGEALVTCASWALSEAGVLPVDARTTIEGIVDAEAALVLHDALCPMTPPDFITACVRRALVEGVVVAGVRPVTDTVKVVHDGPAGPTIGATVDREALVRVVSPIVVPAAVAGETGDLLDDLSPDFAALVAALRARTTVVLVEAPAAAGRVETLEDVRILEALTRPPR